MMYCNQYRHYNTTISNNTPKPKSQHIQVDGDNY